MVMMAVNEMFTPHAHPPPRAMLSRGVLLSEVIIISKLALIGTSATAELEWRQSCSYGQLSETHSLCQGARTIDGFQS